MKEYIKPLFEIEECYAADTAIASTGDAKNCWLCLGGGVTVAEAHAAGFQGTIIPAPSGCGNNTEPVSCFEYNG